MSHVFVASGRRARIWLLVATSTLALLLATTPADGPAHAAASTVASGADAYTRADSPLTNYGGSRSLAVRAGSLRAMKSYVRFDVQVPSGEVVRKATLRLYATSRSSGSGIDVRTVADPTWRETSVTYTNAPPTGAVVAHAGAFSSGRYVALDVTSLVRGTGPVNLALTTDSTNSMTFASREDAARRPQLVVETAAAVTTTTSPLGTTTTAPTGPGTTVPPTTSTTVAPATSTTTVPATTTTTLPTTTTTTTAPPTPAPSVLFGVAAEAVPWNLAELDAFTSAAGKAPGLVMWYQDFAHFADFDPALPDRLIARGAQPMLTWEPWDYTGGPQQPQYALGRIIDGTHDAHIRRWATQIKAWNKPLLLRFAHEMNGTWNSWSEGVNGNLPGQYVAAFRHVHDIFAGVGAGNVTWVWSPNVVYSNSPPLAPFYPGDAYVDRVALDGYNWGNVLPDWKAWLSFEDIFGPGLAQLKALTAKPVMVGEMATTELGGDKAAWIRDTFAALARHPEIVGFIWFNFDKETDWRIQSSGAAQTAFASAVGDPRYAGARP